VEPNKIYIVNLDFKTTARDIEKDFRHYGRVLDVSVPMDPHSTWRSRGYAFVTYDRQKDADAAMKEMNERMYDGRVIYIKKARRTRR